MKRILIKNILFAGLFCSLFACEEILLEDDISDKNVTLVAPMNNAQFSHTGIALTWEPVENAGKYRLQIATPDFTNPMQIVLDTLISRTNFTTQLNLGNYEWRVRAQNGSYNTPYSSRFFSVLNNEDFQNNVVNLSSPTNNLITRTAAQNLVWQSVLGANSYQVQVYDSNNNAIHDQTVTTTFYNYTFPEGNYQWRVRAGNGSQYTLYSSRSILVDTTPPNTPVLTAPANNSTVSETTVNFQWNRTPVAGSAEKDSIYIFTNAALTNLQFKNVATTPFTTTLGAGTYYWYVKGFDQAGNSGNSSSVFKFTVN